MRVGGGMSWRTLAGSVSWFLLVSLAGCGERTLSDSPETLVEHARERLDAGDPAGAEADAARALSLGLEAARGVRAEALVAQARFDEAAQDLDRLIAAHPNQAKWYRLRARVRIEQGNLIDAANDVQRAITLAPGDPEGYRLRARVAQAAGRLTDALADLDRVLGQRRDTDTLVLRGDLRLETGNLAGARADYEAARKLGAAGGTRGLAKTLVVEGKYRQAAELAEQAARQAPDVPENHAVHARAVALAGNLEEARKAWDRGAESAPDAVCIRSGRGVFTLITGDHHVAREDFNTLLQSGERVPYAMLWLLLVDLEQGAARDEVAQNALAFMEQLGIPLEGGGADGTGEASRYAPIFRFLAGRISADQMLEQVPQAWHDPAAYRSLAAFFAGYLDMKQGNSTGARARFQETVAARQRLAMEFWAAGLLMNRLAAR